MDAKDADLSRWQDIVDRAYNPRDTVSIGIVGKYVEYEDSYKSLKEALTHGALAQNLKLEVTWIEAEGLEGEENSFIPQLAEFDGILVPGGFGKRGVEGMLKAIRYAREHKVPYFGICLGMQTACIEFARNVCGLKSANSSEFDPATEHRIIYKLRELLGVEEMGGTMRLGAWDCVMEPDSLAAKAYGTTEISERHRHRYEFNREYEALLTGGRAKADGDDSGCDVCGDCGDSGSPVLFGVPVPSGVQVEAVGAASVVQGVCGGELQESAGGEDGGRKRGCFCGAMRGVFA